MDRTCTWCHKTKPLDCFALRLNSRYKDGISTYCRDCQKEYQKKRRVSGEENKVRRAHTKKHPYRAWAISTIQHHKQKKLEVTFNYMDLTELARESDRCNICHCELDWTPHKGRTFDNTPSLDRVDNAAIVTMENIQIVCHLCNTTKNKRTMSQFIEYCKTVLKIYEEEMC